MRKGKWRSAAGLAAACLLLALLASLPPGCTTDPAACKSECPARALVLYNIVFQNLTRNCTTDSCVRSAELGAGMQMLLAPTGCETSCTTKEAQRNPLGVPF